MEYKIEILANHSIPKTEQIVNTMIHDIENGILTHNAKVPSINKFSKAHVVARDTVEKAYQRLKAKGYLISVKGLGYFVCKMRS